MNSIDTLLRLDFIEKKAVFNTFSHEWGEHGDNGDVIYFEKHWWHVDNDFFCCKQKRFKHVERVNKMLERFILSLEDYEADHVLEAYDIVKERRRMGRYYE